MHGVIGPDGHGVVVADADPARAAETKRRLIEAGIHAAVPAEEGLRLLRGAERFPRFVHPAASRRSEDATLWTAALRRPAVSLEGDRAIVAMSGSSWMEGDWAGALDDIRGSWRPPPKPRVAVFGGAWVGKREPEYEQAETFGLLCADGSIEIVNGGYGGIMAAVSRGARRSRRGFAVVVGVTIRSFSQSVRVNRWLTHEIEAEDLFARLPVISDAEAWVAFPGGVGTLAEIALCWNLVQTDSISPRPLIIVGERWDEALRTFRRLLLAEDAHFDLVRPAATAEEAFALVEELEGAIPRTHATPIEGLELRLEPEAADWVIERLEPVNFDAFTVSGVVPDVFEAYARIIHREGTDNTDGSLPEEQYAVLVETLRAFTSTPGVCHFCMWVGFGFLDVGTEVPKVHLGRGFRSYLLYRGPLTPPPSFRFDLIWQSPAMWWPDDRAWFVATEIDGENTYVGGSRECIEALLAESRLGAVRSDARAPFVPEGDPG